MSDMRGKIIVGGILDDLQDRRGLKHEWEGIDNDIQDEIVAAWEAIANRHIGDTDECAAAIWGAAYVRILGTDHLAGDRGPSIHEMSEMLGHPNPDRATLARLGADACVAAWRKE